MKIETRRGPPTPLQSSRPRGRASPFSLFNLALLSDTVLAVQAPGTTSRDRVGLRGDQPRGAQPWGRAGAPPSGRRSGRPPRLSGPRQARASCPSGQINKGDQWLDGSGWLVVRVAFERVKLDTVQLLEALPAALAREVVLHLGGVLLHVPVERCTLSALVATDLAPAGSRRATPGAGSD